jgi:DNA-binding helix-hairpin-helix protein with protein kinase domain
VEVFFERTQEVIRLVTPPFAGGGESDGVYGVQDDQSRAVKIYKMNERTQERETKAGLQVRTPSPDRRLVWPRGRIYDRQGGNFIGIEMERLTGRQVTVQELLTALARKHAGISVPFTERLQLAAEHADITDNVHRGTSFVIGDFNPNNWLVEALPSGRLLSPLRLRGIDCDGYQFTARDPRTGRAVTFTPGVGVSEYLAQELQGFQSLRGVVRTREQDRFALACVIWMLIKDAHPFTARDTAASGRTLVLSEWITHGWFPHGPASPLPAGWQPVDAGVPFASLPTRVRELATLTFRDGHNDHTARASAAEWRDALTLWANALERAALLKSSWFRSAFSTLDAYRALRPQIGAFRRKTDNVVNRLLSWRPHDHLQAWASRPDVRRKALALALIFTGLTVVPFIRLPAFDTEVPRTSAAVGAERRRLRPASPGEFDWQDAPREWRELGDTDGQGSP